jgi:hypothetical protein
MSTDPILAVIAEHRRVYKAWKKVVRATHATWKGNRCTSFI